MPRFNYVNNDKPELMVDFKKTRNDSYRKRDQQRLNRTANGLATAVLAMSSFSFLGCFSHSANTRRGGVLKSLAITVYICRSRQVNDLPGFSFFFFFVLSASLTPRRSAPSSSSIYSGNSQISSCLDVTGQSS